MAVSWGATLRNFVVILCCLCIYDVEAKDEECGELAGGATCPLNVCCSKWGFCGTTAEFCDTAQGCVSNCGTGFKPNTPWEYDVRNTIIGYWEAWKSSQAGCGKRTAEANIPLGSLSHINTAFAYIQPKTFKIQTIDGIGIEHFQAVTNLKVKSPSTKVWISIGGWSFSDNGTATQPLWSELSSTEANRRKFILGLETFMLQWGFDGVDLDWEYPAAGDRRGKQEDTRNYVFLCQDIKDYFASRGRRWGLSFTAPASYWYMKNFAIKEMADTVDFVNLMTYDMHDSWDSRSNWIGPRVYAHTNMTEIDDALQLLWRNNVTADKVNLGLGFYGRTYTLKDPNCATPGCEFKQAGRAGPCTGQDGYLSYAEIKNIVKQSGTKPVHDEETMTKYMRYDKDQWVSFDDPETIKQKVAYANNIGFRGLFIWAIDQDTQDYELLAATLGDKKLGYFGKVGGSDWTSFSTSGCTLSPCGKRCGPGLQKIDDVLCESGNKDKRSDLCCPLDGSPDPDFCEWRTGEILLFNIGCVFPAANACQRDELLIAKSKFYKVKIPGGGEQDEVCPLSSSGASYCCKRDETGPRVCDGWKGSCVAVKGKTVPEACSAGQKVVTYRTKGCGRGMVEPFCCSASVDLGKLACHWNQAQPPDCNNDVCGQGEVDFGRQEGGGGNHECIITAPATYGQGPRRGDGAVGTERVNPRLCCNQDALRINVRTLPVAVENLFPEDQLKKLPKDSVTDFSLFTDSTMGGQTKASGSTDPNKNSFAWHIIDGPENEVTTIDKRDGSHWELWNCAEHHHEERQSAHMVCTEAAGSATSNCDRIWLGGVAGTVIKMPKGCGPGKYAVAVSLEPAADELPPPHINIRTVGRHSFHKPTVFKLTFDYDFSVLQQRGSKNTLIRIDYSDNPGYWAEVVEARPGNRKTKRELLQEIDDVHDGNWHSWLDHNFNLERRDTADHELHQLHKRWFSFEVDKWISRLKKVETEYTAIRHRVRDIYTYTLFDETKVCESGFGRKELHARLHASMNVDIESSAQLTIIGNLGNLKSFDQSYATLRNKGSVDVVIDFQAYAKLSFGSLENEIAGFAPLGASVIIPGIVTIGPQFKLLGGLKGAMEVHANAQFQVRLAKWDFAQTYPFKGANPYNKENLGILDNGQDGSDQRVSNQTLGPQWSWDAGASGSIEVHLTPQITFGITWNERLNVPNAGINFGVDTYGRVYGEASISKETDVSYCYGVDVGYQVYVSTYAPTLFPKMPNLNQRWDVHGKDYPILKSKDNCGSSGGGARRRDLELSHYAHFPSSGSRVVPGNLADLPGPSLSKEELASP